MYATNTFTWLSYCFTLRSRDPYILLLVTRFRYPCLLSYGTLVYGLLQNVSMNRERILRTEKEMDETKEAIMGVDGGGKEEQRQKTNKQG